jgi:hypothetical protein
MKARVRIALTALVLACFQFVVAPQASSAATSYVSSSSYYAYDSFTSNGTWSRPYGVSVIDYLVVAGGGRGGGSQLSTHFAGGGGGGGGVRYGTIAVAQSSYSIVVGTGQTAGCSQGRGGNSSLSGTDITTVTSTGGGSGACNPDTGGVNPVAGYSGGSGGGGGAQVNAVTFGTGNAGGYSPSEGNDGGAPRSDSSNYVNQGGGGGGGAGAVGASATTACAGNGGSGFSSSITGTAIVYGGGGGGGTRGNSCGGSGGSGGGGSGGLNGGQGSAGTNGLGGGGGGTSLSNGNAGGSGVVIVRYLLSNPDTPNLPTASDSGKSNTDDITNLTSFSLTGVANGGASVQIYDGVTPVGTACTADFNTGAYSCALTGLTQGTHTFTAKASYGGGSAITSTGTLTVSIDTTAPAITPSASISMAENSTSIATVACNETCTLVMTGGADSATLNFTVLTGVLVFKSAPDYEAPTDANLDRTYLVIIQGTDVAGNVTTVNYSIAITNLNESSALGTPTVSGLIYKGVSINLSVTSNVAGKVRFFMDGKRIANCLAISTSGSYPNYTATCPWKPASNNRHTVYAAITPTDNTFSASNSITSEIFILKRTTTR